MIKYNINVLIECRGLYHELLGNDPSETETLRGRNLNTYFSSYSHRDPDSVKEDLEGDNKEGEEKWNLNV